MKGQPIDIYEHASGEFVQAVLYDRLESGQVIQAEQDWGPERLKLILEMIDKGVKKESFPEHWQWNWELKARNLNLLAYECLGIEYEGLMQGLAMIKLAGYNARLKPDEGKPLVYLSYIESAPWNTKVLKSKPQFGGIGSRLIEAVIRVSLREGFHGRIGLHALQQAENFYRSTWRMEDFGLDRDSENLRYFELRRKTAEELLKGGQP